MTNTFLLLRAFFLIILLLSSKSSSLGINYGQVANNLPSPKDVVTLLSSIRVTKTRIYDTNPQVLTAFANSGVEIIVTVPNEMLTQLTNPQQALDWVATNIKPYVPATKITGISVGNEIFSTTNDQVLMSNLVPAMISIQEALTQYGLGGVVHVSSANSLAVLENSYPPSSGAFDPELINYIGPFLRFLAETNSPFWINAYPYFAYKDDPSGIELDYVLANPNAGMMDPYTKLRYDNMLYAQVDAVAFAMARVGFGGIEVRVSETGWPSKGDGNEYGATVDNASAYNRNLLARQWKGQGTPLRPNQRLEVYLFALFNEDLKPGPSSERNYGLYKPDMTMVYNVGMVKSSPTQSMLPAAISSIFPSSAKKGYKLESGSLWYMILICSLAFQALMLRF